MARFLIYHLALLLSFSSQPMLMLPASHRWPNLEIQPKAKGRARIIEALL